MHRTAASTDVDKAIAASLAQRFFGYSSELNAKILAAGIGQESKRLTGREIDPGELDQSIQCTAHALGLYVVRNPPASYQRSAGELVVINLDIAKFDTDRPAFERTLTRQLSHHRNAPTVLVLQNTESDARWLDDLAEKLTDELPRAMVMIISPSCREEIAEVGAAPINAPRRRLTPTLKFRPKP